MRKFSPYPWSSLLWTAAAVLIALAIAPSLSSAAPAALQLTVDGQPVTLGAPLTRVGDGGEVFAPLQALAEALGAEWLFDPDPGFIRLVRGEVTVQMWVGQALVQVDHEVPEATAVAPTLANGVPQVPLAVLAHAWGAQYTWDAAQQTAALVFTGTPPPATTTDGTTGMLLQAYPGPPPAFLVQAGAGIAAQAYVAAAGITYTRAEEGQPTKPATLNDLHPGDQVHLTLNAQDRVTRLAATYRERTGKLHAVGQNRLILADGTTLDLGAGVQVHTAAGEDVDLASLTPGADLTVRYNPTFNQVWDITASHPVGPQQAAVQLLSVAPANYSRPLRAGETLQVLIQGTAGATVTFSLGDEYPHMATGEEPAGRYAGEFVVPANADLTSADLTASLTKGAQQAEPLTAEQRITFDTIPPAITRPVPAPNSQLSNATPALAVLFSDQGSGPDLTSVRFALDGQTLTEGLVVLRTRAAVQAPALTAGLHQADFTVKDKAGNEKTRRWNFTVTLAPDMPLIGVSQDGLQALTEGDTLTVQAYAVAPLTNPVADLGTFKTDLPMVEVSDQAGLITYRATYQVVPGDRAVPAPVTVRAKDDADQDLQLAATTPFAIRMGLPKSLKVNQPTEGDVAPRDLTIAGLAPPASEVRITLTYNTRILVELSGQVAQVTCTANEDGQWQTEAIDLKLPLLGVADKYQVVAELLDADGTVVETQTINIKGE